MTDQGKQQQEWLRKIELDQNIVGLETIEDTLKNEAFRKWFLSQVLSPTINMGHYNNDTGRIVLNAAIPGLSFNTAAVATHTLTVPAGSTYRVIAGAFVNNTRNYGGTLTASIGGQAMTFMSSAAGSTTLGRWCIWIGSAGLNASNAYPGIAGPVVLAAGDTITFTDASFVAGDDMEFYFFYEVI